ncbi:MAG TPA: radical SAM protein [Verrucomicrobiae bacterium]|nr:radical SAM protein [Verrucomicrobiae bacterium]
MKILLILPAAESVRVTRERPAVTDRAMLRFSVLPLTAVAALTPRECPVRIVDENVEALDFDADADVVGVTFMTALAPRAYEIAREFRARGKIVVAGGYHATLYTPEVVQHFDAVVVGDAEGAWPQLLQDIEAHRLQKLYCHMDHSAELRTPVPRRDLLAAHARDYVTLHAVQTGRGCPHGCRYCSITTFHQRKYRQRPLADVLAELRDVPRHFMFVDDNIISDRRYAAELFRAMAPPRKRWVSQCSIEIADDPELLRLAHRAGCRGLFIGIESTNAQNLAAVGKAFNDSAHYQQKLARIRRAGIGVIAGIIVGMDKDDVSVFEQTLKFLDRARIDSLQLNILTPLPGTPLFADMDTAGRVTDRDWSHYDFRHVVFRPARMTAQELQDGADWLYAQFYRLDRILLRFLRAVFAIGWLPAVLSLKLNLTYRYDNRREKIIGRNPARSAARDSYTLTALQLAGVSGMRL